jgi:hypothetical protein
LKNGGASATPQPRNFPVLTVLLLFEKFKTKKRLGYSFPTSNIDGLLFNYLCDEGANL